MHSLGVVYAFKLYFALGVNTRLQVLRVGAIRRYTYVHIRLAMSLDDRRKPHQPCANRLLWVIQADPPPFLPKVRYTNQNPV
jgi:hypothetical protein